MVKQKSSDLKNYIFLLIIILISILTLGIFSRYLNIIIISFIIVQLFYPVYYFLKRKTKSSGLANFLTILSVMFFVIVPLILIILFTLLEVQNLANSTTIISNLGDLETGINNLISGLNTTLTNLNLDFTINRLDLTQIISDLDKTAFITDQLLPFVRDLASLSGEIIFNLFLLVLSLIYLFPAYEKIPEALTRISPLENSLDKIFIDKFKDTVRGVVKGSFVVALLQATAVIIPLIVLQVGAPLLLWIFMVLLSIVPVGSGLVWGPISIGIIISGITSGSPLTIIIGIALFVYSAIIINVIDTTFRPKLMKNTVNLHPLVTIFSVLGGISLFGVLGILYGPLIVVLFLSVMEVYRTKYDKQSEELHTEIE
jgi:predicted PurR-regulated permease PerM